MVYGTYNYRNQLITWGAPHCTIILRGLSTQLALNIRSPECPNRQDLSLNSATSSCRQATLSEAFVMEDHGHMMAYVMDIWAWINTY